MGLVDRVQAQKPPSSSAPKAALTDKEVDFILDPFCGSGTSCVAARNLNRNYLGIEINPDYVNLANNRMEEPDSQQQELFI